MSMTTLVSVADDLTENGIIAEQNAESIMVSPADIVAVDADNTSRHYGGDDAKELKELAKSMQEKGQLQPVTVRRTEDGKLRLVFGFRRHKAGMLILQEDPNWKIKAEVSDVDEAGQAVLNLTENVRRKDMSPIDRGFAIVKLLEQGYKRIEAAKELGVSPAQVTILVALTELHPKIQKAVHAGTVTIQAAYALSQMPPAEAMEQFEAASGADASGKTSKVTRDSVRQQVDEPEDAGDGDGGEAPEASGGRNAARVGKKNLTAKQFIHFCDQIEALYKSEEEVKNRPSKEMFEIVQLFNRFMQGRVVDKTMVLKLRNMFPSGE